MKCSSFVQNQRISEINELKENSSVFLHDEENLFQERLKTSESDTQSIEFQIGPSLFPSRQQSLVSQHMETRTQSLKLALVTIFNKSKKALNTLSFDLIKQSAKKQKNIGTFTQQFNLFPTDQFNLHEIVQKTLSQGSILQNGTSKAYLEKTDLHRRIFSLESKILQQSQKINKLTTQLEENQNTLLKQTQKKTESLRTFAEEIRQKNQYIFQLKNSIKQYQKMLGINHQRLSVQNVLIEDQLQVKRNCLRLQNINERLNNDLKSSLQKVELLKNEVYELKHTVLTLKSQNQDLKEKNFDLTLFVEKNSEITEVYSNLCQKLNKKIESIKIQNKNKERQINLYKGKNSNIFSSGDLFSSKKTQASLSSIPLSRKSSLKDLETDQKIEEIFSFIFNIHEENYQLNNEQLFDEDELKLLKSHKNLFLINTHNQNPQITQQNETKRHKTNTNEVFYIQANKNNQLIENSFLDALDSQNQTYLPMMIQLEKDNARFIQKISDLKKMHMHIRDLLLNFFKTIDFSNIRPQTLKIVQVIFDLFEYSEDERSQLIKQKKKKFWGII